MAMTNEPRLLKAREAARYLSVSLRTLHEIERRGMLAPFRTPGGHRRYTHDMLDQYLNARLRVRSCEE